MIWLVGVATLSENRAKTRTLHKNVKGAAPENSIHPQSWPTRRQTIMPVWLP